MDTVKEEDKDINEIKSTVMELVPPLKTVDDKYHSQTVQEVFDEVLNYRSNPEIFKSFNRFNQILSQEISRAHGEEAGNIIRQQLAEVSVLHTQVHQSMMRSFDANKRLDENGIAKPNEHYNTLIMQSEILWASILQKHNLHSVSCNTGLITMSNETSPAFIQYGKAAHDAIKICNNDAFRNVISCTNQLSEEQILKSRKEIAAIRDPEQKKKAHGILEKLAAAEDFNVGVAQVYSQQIKDLFDESIPQPYAVEMNGIFNSYLIENLKDENSLMHYIFSNEKTAKFYYEHFENIAMGWKEISAKDAEGNPTDIACYDAFWAYKDAKKNGEQSKKAVQYYDGFIFNKNNGEIKMLSIAEMIQKIETQEITPKNLMHVTSCFLEAGILTVGGIAQAPYNTVIKNRIGTFIDELETKIESGEFPPLPQGLSMDNLQQRKTVIQNMITEIPVAGFGIMQGEKPYELASYKDFIDGTRKIGSKEIEKISNTKVGDAIKAAAITIFEYKLGAKDYQKLVGDQVITFPQTILSQKAREEAGAQVAPFISQLPMTKEEYIAQKQKTLLQYQQKQCQTSFIFMARKAVSSR